MTMDVIPQRYVEAMPLADLSEHPQNPRRGDDDAVNESVTELGFFGAVLVQESTGHVIAGNTRYRVARRNQADAIPAFILDVDDETALRILLADNRTADLAHYDDPSLLAAMSLLAETTRGLAGTAYTQVSYDLLMQQSQAADSILGGVRQGMTPGDRVDGYETSDVRSIVLPYSREQFDEVTVALARLRTAWDKDSNADVVGWLVLDAVAGLDGEVEA